MHVEIGSYRDIYSPTLSPFVLNFVLERSWEQLNLSFLFLLCPSEGFRSGFLLRGSWSTHPALQQVSVLGRWMPPQPVPKPTHLLNQTARYTLLWWEGISLFSDGCASEGMKALNNVIPLPNCSRYVPLGTAVTSWPQLWGRWLSGAAASISRFCARDQTLRKNISRLKALSWQKRCTSFR